MEQRAWLSQKDQIKKNYRPFKAKKGLRYLRYCLFTDTSPTNYDRMTSNKDHSGKQRLSCSSGSLAAKI